MHKLLSYQLRSATSPDKGLDAETLLSVVERTYHEFDRERRLNDRAQKLMEEELKAANEAARAQGERKLAEALESAPNAIALASPALAVQSLNSAMRAICALFDCTPAPGEDFTRILRVVAPHADVDQVVRDLAMGRNVELRISGHWFLCGARGLSDGGYAIAFTDISALKEREAALAEAKEAAEAANRLKSKFLATMSHELRTPLNAILGFSDLIAGAVMGEGGEAWARYRDYAASIHESGQHLLLLISDVLDLSKIESGSYRLNVEPFDLGDLALDSLALVRPQAENGSVRLLPVARRGDLGVEGDKRALKQVMVNLLSNAVKFTPAGGEVEIAAEETDGDIVIRVRDTGIGIAADHLNDVFEPFHQGDARIARRYEGTGLGLSISRGIVEAHGGALTLESAEGIGTTAAFRLPKCATPARPARATA